MLHHCNDKELREVQLHWTISKNCSRLLQQILLNYNTYNLVNDNEFYWYSF